jgi:tetratricopeptide (TPR) repeat protein
MALEQHHARGMPVEPSSVAMALQNMGLAAVQSGVFDKALLAYDLLLELGYKHSVPQWAGAAHANLGVLALVWSQLELAYWHFLQEVELARASENKRWEGRALYKVAKCLLLQPQIVDGHARAQKLFERACSLAEAAGDSEGLARAQRQLEASKQQLPDTLTDPDAHTDANAKRKSAGLQSPSHRDTQAGHRGTDERTQGENSVVQHRRSSSLPSASSSSFPTPGCLHNSCGVHLPWPAAVRSKACLLQDVVDTAWRALALGGAGAGGHREARRALPVLTYLRALAEISGSMSLKARACNGVGLALKNLRKPAIALAWEQKDLKYSALAGNFTHTHTHTSIVLCHSPSSYSSHTHTH